MNEVQHVVFALDGERFGLPISRVERILAAPALTRLPMAPPAMRGMFDLRGDVLPVLDTRVILNMADGEPQCLLVVECAGQRIALTADRVDSIAEFHADDIQTVRAGNGHEVTVGRTGDKLTLLLDPDHLIPSEIAEAASSLVSAAA